MGISYKNNSGYPDPTAYSAVQNIEAKEKMLHIQYPTGYMDLRLDAFFPCTVDRAKKVFKLICQYCPQVDKDRLLHFLREKAKQCDAQIRTFEQKRDASTDKSEINALNTRIRDCARMKSRLNRNIELFLYREGKTK